ASSDEAGDDEDDRERERNQHRGQQSAGEAVDDEEAEPGQDRFDQSADTTDGREKRSGRRHLAGRDLADARLPHRRAETLPEGGDGGLGFTGLGLAGQIRHAHTSAVGGVPSAVAADLGMCSGMRSRGGIGVVPRTTTTLRNRSSILAAASSLTAPSPAITPRRNHLGPSTPTNLASLVDPG